MANTRLGTFAALVLGPWLLFAGSARAQFQDPGVRWQVPSQAQPRRVVPVGHGEWFWLSRTGPGGGLELLSGQSDGKSALIYRDSSTAAAVGPVEVGARGPAHLYSLAQFAPGGGTLIARLGRHSAVGAAGAPGAPLVVRELPWSQPGPVRLAVPKEGFLVGTAQGDPALGRLRFALWDGDDLSLRLEVEFPALALRALVVDRRGERWALSGGNRLWVLDGDGAVLLSAPLDFASEALALSADGRTLAAGAAGRVRFWREGPAGYAPLPDGFGAPGELPSALVLDGPGNLAAVGWWDSIGGKSARVETRNLELGTHEVHLVQVGGPLSKQNTVSSLVFSGDGRRLAATLWGQDGSEPEFVLFDPSGKAAPFSLDLPGSAFAAALDEGGTRALVLHKSAHANDLAQGGAAVLFDTGERDCQLLAPLLAGQSSALWVRFPNAALALLVVGAPSAAGWVLPAVEGELWVDAAGTFALIPVALDGLGTGLLPLAVPNTPALLGLPLALQGIRIDPLPRASAHPVRVAVL